MDAPNPPRQLIAAAPSSVAGALFSQLRMGGEQCLQGWVDDSRREGVNLECKRPAQSQQPGMSRADVEQMAKAASAFANSEGGVLIFGIDARDRDGQDALQALVPIANLAAFHRSAERAVADLLSPPHDGIELLAVPSVASPDSGYLAVCVEQSERRPHRSLKDQVYYRRSGDRTAPMEHSDLKDAMSRTLGPELRMSIRIEDIFGDTITPSPSATFTFLFVIEIENVGGGMARHPFLHLDPFPGLALYDPVTDRRRGPAWSRLRWDGREERLQGGVDDVIPVSTKVRVAYAYANYRPQQGLLAGVPLAAAQLILSGRFGCDGFRTHGFHEVFAAPELIVELDRRKIPISS